MSEKTRYASVGEISYERSERIDSPSTSEIKRFVGLEHFDQGNLDIVRFGSCVDLGSTMKKCVAGDTLIARRNVYLNRASRCNFDALCSGDAIVLRENECVVPGFLSILFNSDSFWKFASSNADGTMSKRLSVSHLKSYEFCLPSVENQKKFVDLIWKLENLKTKLVMELENLNLLIKSQFIEMFGDVVFNPMCWPTKEISKVAPSTNGENTSDEEHNWLLNLDAIEANTGIVLFKNYVSSEELSGSIISFSEDHVLYSKLRPYLNKVVMPDESGFGTSELIPLLPDVSILNRTYLARALMSDTFVQKFTSAVAGTKMPRVLMDTFRKFLLPLPPIDLQIQFADFVKQVDKSKLDSEFDLINLYQNHYFCNAGVLI